MALRTFGETLTNSARFQEIDETNIGDHWHLTRDDECYFLWEYTSGKDYNFSATNRLIINLKKKPSRQGKYEYRYKLAAMAECARCLGQGINAKWLKGATLVPVPPSKARDHPEYDVRMTFVCQQIPATFPLDVRELVLQRESIEAAHESGGERPKVQDLLAIYEINEAVAAPAPARIGIVDDVLTAGTHYRAVHTILSQRFPSVPIVGFFIARRVFANDRFEDVADQFNDLDL